MTQPPKQVFIGPGRLAQALAPAMAEAGWPLVAVGAREGSRAAALVGQVPGVAVRSPAQAVAEAPDGAWVWLCVPDGQLSEVAETLPWRPGLVALHGAGATGLEVLAPAQAAGAEVAGFHPLQLLAGGRAVLAGCGAGIEASSTPLLAQLDALARDLGMVPLRLKPETRRLYHAGANLAASGVLAVLAEALQAWQLAGLEVDDALPLLLPLTQGALAAATSRGLAGAVAGPVPRGDVGVLAAQLQALAASPQGAGLYAELARRQLALAEQAGRLNDAQAQAIKAALSPYIGLKRD
ncbi:DUF2520 domain-containing protein [Roseateles paludis]|jgi:predicted short-subunit dehydrogenase-like oxidoreductase (DUF2520 family)|uniref:DUF2520 domain-containing protein n=1 Tax=Roseateles paludis TaxID=3145238 RepID=A0ABV0G7G9_9BURK